jgi:hypothetical protein
LKQDNTKKSRLASPQLTTSLFAVPIPDKCLPHLPPQPGKNFSTKFKDVKKFLAIAQIASPEACKITLGSFD